MSIQPNTLEVALDRCVKAGLLRYYTDQEMEQAVRPLVEQINQQIDDECVRILCERSKSV